MSGLLDIQGFWKREAHLRQALWNDQPMVYAAAWATGDESSIADSRTLGRNQTVERWGWTADARKNIPVEVYSNCESVELLLNGRSVGEKRIADRLAPVVIFAVPNEAGTVEVLGKRGGNTVARFQLKAIGPAERIQLTPDLRTLKSEGRQVSTVEVVVVDRDGNRVPDANPEITVALAGDGRLIAVDNADLTDNTSAQGGKKKAYQGRAVAVVRSGAQPGRVTLRASAAGLTAGETVITVEQ
jgi:beta-galactosidase